MLTKLQTASLKYLAIPILTIFTISLTGNHAIAQTNEAKKSEQLQPLRSGVGILNFTGNMSWENTYMLSPDGLTEQTNTELQVEFQNIRMLSPHFGLGYSFFTTVFMSGFFEGGGLGGVGAGTAARYYPLDTKRWQPYLEGNFSAGYNLALSDAIGINDVGGFRYRTGLRAGLNYRVSNAFGLFIEIGPSWEYSEELQMDSRAFLIEIGIVLFRF